MNIIRINLKRIFTVVLALTTALFVSNTAKAQLQDGSVAPDFTATDLNGNTHQLYDYLDQGYSVVIDFSAAWNGPCWNYHNSGALEDLYINHGPTGMSGVSGSTTNDVMVFFIEGEGSNTLAQLQGTTTNQQTSGYTQGNWINGTPYPIIDNASFNDDYNIGYFPTVYLICPNRIITEVGQAPTATIYTAAQACPVSTHPNDPMILAYTGETSSCAAIDIKANLQNLGSNNLTSAIIKAYFNNVEILSYNWTGNLTKYAIDEVTVGQYTPTQNGTLKVKITSANDDVANDEVSIPIGPAPQAANQYITVKITTDAYGSETTWKLKKGNGQVVAQGGPYNDLQAAGETIQTPVSVTLPAVDCYTFEILDEFGDGMCCSYGNGAYSVTDGANNVLASGAQYTSTEKKIFSVTDFGIPVISSFTPTMICSGSTITITGTNFTGATSVTIGGTPVSSFTVNSSTSITATVGSGTTGLISVVTPTGAATSSSVLTITPQPSTPTITPSGSVTICQGQSVTLTSSAASSYVWSNGQQMQSITVSPTQTTSYTVTVGSGNCTATSQAVTVVVNSSLPTPAITPSGSVTICQGESVTLTSSSASSYVWSNGQQTQSITVTPTQTTSYTVTVGSGNCTATSQAITVVVGAAPVVTNQPQNQLSSLGQTAQFVATTSTPSVNYQWQSDVGLGFQNLSNAGQYSGVNTNTLLVSSITTNNDNQAFRCVISAGGCSINSNSAMLSVCSLGITSQPQSQTVNLSTNATFSVSGTNIQTYQWQSDLGFGYQNLSNAGQYSGVNTNTLTLSNATTANNGQAFRCAVSLDGCSDTTAVALLTVNNNVGISEASIPTFSVYPNPANENITISLTKLANNVVVEVYDMYGKLMIAEVNKSGKQFDLNTSTLAPSVYMVKLMLDNKVSNRAFIKL
jgi:hypothetical protein